MKLVEKHIFLNKLSGTDQCVEVTFAGNADIPSGVYHYARLNTGAENAGGILGYLYNFDDENLFSLLGTEGLKFEEDQLPPPITLEQLLELIPD